MGCPVHVKTTMQSMITLKYNLELPWNTVRKQYWYNLQIAMHSVSIWFFSPLGL
jgi:hypothetical protein